MRQQVLKLMNGSRESVKRSVCVIFLLTFILHANFLNAQQVAKTSPAGTKMWVYTPPGYSTSTAKYPLLVFLHGGGEIGDDLTKLTTGTSQHYPPKLISMKQWDTKRPFIVVSPQLKRDLSYKNLNDQVWPTAYVNEVVEYIRRTYRIDAYRIYITGISLGGAGSWDYAAAYPTKVAALVPISGKSDLTKACNIKNIPVWAFHGENDALVTSKFSTDMVNKIKACAGIFKPRLNLLYARAHEGWNEIYNVSNGYNIYDWFLKFRKNNTTNKTPYVNAGIDNKMLLRTTTHHIAGDFFDWDGSISVIKWTKVAGPTVTLAGTNTAFLRLSGLKVGVYEFQLSVTDNKGAVSSDRVKLEVVSPTAPPAVTGLILVNGKTNANIGPLKEGQVINKTTLGTTEFNVKATVSSGVGSVRYRVNADQHTKTANSPGPYVIKRQATTPEWVPTNGTCVICATPYPLSGGRGTPGISLCYKVTFTQSSTTTTAASVESQPEEVITIRAIDDILISNFNEGNQWVLNGEDIPGATGPIYKPHAPGEYFVRITTRPSFDVSNSVAIDAPDANERKPSINVFPNPANDYIQVQGESVSAGASYRIIRSGYTVQEGQLQADKRIPLPASFARGDYVLIIRTNDRGNQSVKFIID